MSGNSRIHYKAQKILTTRDKIRLRAWIYDASEESGKESKEGCILFLHDFTGGSGQGFYPEMCLHLSKKISTARFDLRGQGVSEGNFFQTRISHMMIDIETVIQFLQKEKGYTKIVLLGHGFGASIGLWYTHLAKKYNTDIVIGNICLSGGGDFSHEIKRIFRKVHIAELENTNIKQTNIMNWSKDGRKDAIGKQFLDELREFSGLEHLKDITLPILLFHGVNDEDTSFERTQEVYDTLICERELYYLEEVNHMYNFYDEPNLDTLESIEEVIINWIKMYNFG